MLYKLLKLKKQTCIVLMLLFLAALLLRMVQLGTLPANLMEDEVLSGYVGRFILQNGMDLYGNAWPLLYFDKFGDYYIIGPMYLTGLSTFLFGMTAFAVRFPAALLGSLAVFPMFFFVRMIFQKDRIALFAAGLLAVTPWHVILSRSTVEGIIGSTIFLTGIVFLLRFLTTRSLRWLIGSCILLLSTYFVYHPFRMYVPVIFLPLFVLYFSDLRKNIRSLFIPLIISTVFFFGLTIYISTTPWGSGRLEQTSIFSPLARVEGEQQEQIYNLGGGRILEARIFHNKVVAFGREYVTQYLSYFSPNYLFTDGGAESRYDIPNQGLLYITYLLLIAAAFLPIQTRLKTDKRLLVFFLYVLLLSPAPAAFTYYGAPNIHRSVFLVLMLMVPAAYGLYKLSVLKYARIIIPVIIFVIACEFAYFFHQYSTQSDIYTAIRRNDGQAALVTFL